MCGIVGFTGPEDERLLRSMNRSMVHRGPDDEGHYTDASGQVHLGMRRLSIIDLPGGKQPMTNEDGTLHVICNGEIYNSPELRQRLQSHGHRFKTKNSDVEVLLHLYEDKGTDMLADLNGMFAFVLYDSRKRLLFGARDRMGIKPLYTAHQDGKFAFASELKCLLHLPWITRDIDATSLYHYMSLQFVPSPRTIFTDIQKLPAAHYFLYDLGRHELKVEKYWDLDFSNIEDLSAEEWLITTRKKLKEAVKRWTLSDVPFACSLSGGLDSSAMVGLLAQAGVKDLRTYSVGFSGPGEQEYNELPLARKVAETWGTQHHEIVVDPSRVLQDLERMVWHLDEPYGGGLPSWYVYEAMARDVKVAMTGTGGDELFGNYRKFKIHERPGWYRSLKAIKDAARDRTPRSLRDSRRHPIGHFYFRYMSDALKDRVVFEPGEDRTPQIKTEPYLEQLWSQAGTDSPRNAVAYVDFKLQLPEEFLHMTDRFSMAHSIEARVPFLDHPLVEHVFRIPPELRTRDNDPKHFLKRVAADLLPPELLTAPKRGFKLPLDLWTRNELKPMVLDLLGPAALKRQQIFSPQVYRFFVEPHVAGRKDCTEQVWTLLMFQLWHRKFCASN